MEKESDILKIVTEDILRMLAERGNKVPLESIKDEVKAFDSIIFEAKYKKAFYSYMFKLEGAF